MKKTRLAWIADVAMLHDSDACLLWPFSVRGGRRGEEGYPALSGGYGHRFLCEKVHGPAPSSEYETEHTCGVRRCMNPRHIKWARHRDNCARRTAHGTQTIGERHGMARLTEAQVLEIRSAPKFYGSETKLAAKFCVSKAAVYMVRSGKNWKHLPLTEGEPGC